MRLLIKEKMFKRLSLIILLVIIATTVFYVNCYENYNTYIVSVDQACIYDHRTAIYTGIYKLNTLSNRLLKQDLVKLGGLVEVDHTNINVGQGVIACYYEEPDWYRSSKYNTYIGWGNNYQDIRLFLFRKPNISVSLVSALSMHELLHLVGIRKHSDNRKDIMYKEINTLSLSYTPNDIKIFCERYNCRP